MSTFVSTATIFIERTRRHAAISALLVLQRRIAADPERAGKLRAMPGADFERIFLDPHTDAVSVLRSSPPSFFSPHPPRFPRNRPAP